MTIRAEDETDFDRNGFMVTMKKTSQTVAGNYKWIATLTAKGGYTTTVEQAIEIRPACRSEEVASWTKVFKEDLPYTGDSEAVTLIDGSSVYLKYKSNDEKTCT